MATGCTQASSVRSNKELGAGSVRIGRLSVGLEMQRRCLQKGRSLLRKAKRHAANEDRRLLAGPGQQWRNVVQNPAGVVETAKLDGHPLRNDLGQEPDAEESVPLVLGRDALDTNNSHWPLLGRCIQWDGHAFRSNAR